MWDVHYSCVTDELSVQGFSPPACHRITVLTAVLGEGQPVAAMALKGSAGTYLLGCKNDFLSLQEALPEYSMCAGGISDLRVIKIRAHITHGGFACGRRADKVKCETVEFKRRDFD